MYRCQIRDINHLKEQLIREWRRFDQRIIDRAVGQWRQHLRALAESVRKADILNIRFRRYHCLAENKSLLSSRTGTSRTFLCYFVYSLISG